MTEPPLPQGPASLSKWRSGPRAASGAQAGSAWLADESETFSYSAFFRKLWRRKVVLLTVSALSFTLALAVVLRLPPHFVAHGLLVIGDPIGKIRSGSAANQLAGSTLPDNSTVRTEVEVLKSPQLALEVIRQLNLADRAEFNPTLQPSTPFAALASLKNLSNGSGQSLDAQSEAAIELSRTVDNFLQRLRVEVKETSRVVDVAFGASDRELAMRVANAVIERYVGNQAALRSQSARRMSAWLQDRISELQARVELAETAVEKFRSGAGLFSTPGGSPLLLKQMTDVSAELATAQSASAAIQARLNQLASAAPAKGPPLSELVDSPFMRTLEALEADALQKFAEASASLGEKHPVTAGLAERLRHARTAKRHEAARVMATLESDLKIARAKEQDLNERLRRLQEDVSRMNGAEVTLRKLERDAQADRLVLNNFLARFKENGEGGDVDTLRPEVQVVSFAQMPVEPERPKKALLLAVCAAISLMAGAVAVHLVDAADRSLRTLGDMEDLGVAGLGMVPVARAARLSPAETARFGSTYREAIKTIYSKHFWADGRPPHVTAVTSALPAEGKTNLALSLAALAAQAGHTVLLIDTDVWKKGASAASGIRNGPGLGELLEGKISSGAAIVVDVRSGADVMVPGQFSRGSLLSWLDRLPAVLDSLRSQYEVIIIDTAPVCSVCEASLLAARADATIMAVKWGSTPREAVKSALRKLADAGAIVSGGALTLVQEKDAGSYGYSERGYLESSASAYRSASGAVTWAVVSGSAQVGPRWRTTLIACLIAFGANGLFPGRLRRAAATLGGIIKAHSRSNPVEKSPPPAYAAVSERSFVRQARHEPFKASRLYGPRCAVVVLGIQEEYTRQSYWYSPPQNAVDALIRTINRTCRLAAGFGFSVICVRHQPSGLIGKTAFRLLSDPHDQSHLPAGERPEFTPSMQCSTPTSDAFANPQLHEHLRASGVRHLFLVGIEATTFVSQTARSALARGYRVSFIRDGVLTAFEKVWDRQLQGFEARAAFGVTSAEFCEIASTAQRATVLRPSRPPQKQPPLA